MKHHISWGVVLYSCLLLIHTSLALSPNNAWLPKCSRKCKCEVRFLEYFQVNFKTVDCRGKNFTSLSSIDIPHDTEALLFSGNQVHNLTALPEITSLHLLDLSNNGMTDLHNHWLFEHQYKLMCLNLSNNNIQQLQHGSFSGLKYLNVLDLSNNQLDYIEIHAFGGLNHLQTLLLDGNKLKHIEKEWFVKMSGLTELSVSSNRLKSIENNTLTSLSELHRLFINNNSIKQIESFAFQGLKKLELLDISENKFESVPTSELQKLPNLRTLRFDNNEIRRLDISDFSRINVFEISVSYNSKLYSINYGAFSDLPNLQRLQIHDNDHLLYLNPEAFVNVPHLRYLYLHNNQLMAFSSKIQESLPELTEVHLYNNPIHCDCNSRWIKTILDNVTVANTTNRKLDFVHSENILCDDPLDRYKIPLEQISIHKLSNKCPPTTLPLFKDQYNLSIGETLHLECHAIGVPEPAVHWLLPGGKTLNDNQTDLSDHIEIIGNSTLIINHVTEEDEGTYGCVAINAITYDISSTAVNVHFDNIKLKPFDISPNYITVTWTGSNSILKQKDFQVTYRQVKGTDSVKVFHLRPYLHRYTIPNLRSFTTYELCIYFRAGSFKHKLHCINVTTKHKSEIPPGITKIADLKTVIAICIAIAVCIVLVCTFLVCRTFRRRKDYEAPKVRHKVEETQTIIPLDNLYAPPNTPLCTSRTSLISQHD